MAETIQKTLGSHNVIDWTELVKRSCGGQQGIICGKGEKITRLLMSKRSDAPYIDQELRGFGIIYEGEDVKGDLGSKNKDQELTKGNLCLFNMAMDYLRNKSDAEPVQVFEKIDNNMWIDHGERKLVGVSKVFSGGRYVYRFHLSE